MSTINTNNNNINISSRLDANYAKHRVQDKNSVLENSNPLAKHSNLTNTKEPFDVVNIAAEGGVNFIHSNDCSSLSYPILGWKF